ncbi:MAG: type II toxin-antitoxin system PemK/MazF family toxin [Nocardioides sp.]
MKFRARLAGLLKPGSAAVGAEPETDSAYAPEIDGEPDPGEVVWAWVPYEDDPSQGKDRPVLVIDTAGDGQGDGPDDGWVGLMLSSQDHDRDAEDEARHGRHWMDVGSGGWDPQGRPSEVRLDRLIHLDRDGVRREGAALDERIFDEVLAARRGLDG